MADDDDDLYGDIESLAKSAQAEHLQQQLKKSQQHIKSLESELREYKEQVKVLNIEKSQIEQNMMCLYDTAVTEIARKDKQIVELRAEVLSYKTNKKK